MLPPLFRIIEHTLPGQHIRDYPHATRHSQEEELHIAIKHYIPLNNPRPQAGDLTIIGGHANGFPKELYEPLWDELLQRLNRAGYSIRGIWIADVASQGQSGVLNEGRLGNDPSWFDHPRDLLHMVNHFRDQMPRPLIGVGHSMGGSNLVNLSLLHPRLFETLVLMDPVMQRWSSAHGYYAPTYASSIRRDVWPSREAARTSFLRSKFYQAWDPRVLDRWIQYGLRALPTEVHPHAQPAITPAPTTTETTLTPPPGEVDRTRQVTLTTTKHQEVFTFLRPHFPALDGEDQGPVSSDLERFMYPDMDPNENTSSPFYRPESTITFHNLPFLRPSALYVFPSDSQFSGSELRAEKIARTGVGVGGSGGAVHGRVKEVTIPGTGHLVPMEKVAETANACAQWICTEMTRWRKNEDILEAQWRKTPAREKYTLSERHIVMLKDGTDGKFDEASSSKRTASENKL